MGQGNGLSVSSHTQVQQGKPPGQHPAEAHCLELRLLKEDPTDLDSNCLLLCILDWV